MLWMPNAYSAPAELACLEYPCRSRSPAEKSFYSEVVHIAHLIRVMPATNAVREH